MDPGSGTCELVIPCGPASLGCRSRDRPLTPTPCRQGLEYERWQLDQSTLLLTEADRYDERQATQRRLDDSAQGLRIRRQVLLRSLTPRQRRQDVRHHG